MADYEAMARSSYFKVKSEDDFMKFCEKLDLRMIDQTHEKHGRLLGFIVECDHGTIPNWECDDEGDTIEIDFFKELAQQLDPKWSAIVMEAGAEKMRYIGGFSFLVRADGDVTRISLTDIYEHAEKMTEFAYTACEY